MLYLKITPLLKGNAGVRTVVMDKVNMKSNLLKVISSTTHTLPNHPHLHSLFPFQEVGNPTAGGHTHQVCYFYKVLVAAVSPLIGVCSGLKTNVYRN